MTSTACPPKAHRRTQTPLEPSAKWRSLSERGALLRAKPAQISQSNALRSAERCLLQRSPFGLAAKWGRVTSRIKADVILFRLVTSALQFYAACFFSWVCKARS
jgi:hypothetical protein